MPLRLRPGRSAALLRSILAINALATAVLTLTIFAAYSRANASTDIFVSFLVLLVLHVFAARSHREVAMLARRERIVRSGTYCEMEDIEIPLSVGAGLAVRQAFFILLLGFDVSWLSHAYLYPSVAGTWVEYLGQLALGPIPGWGFLAFTVVFWLAYIRLLVVGMYSSPEIDEYLRKREPGEDEVSPDSSKEFWIPVPLGRNGTVLLEGIRHPNEGETPLILFPGFFQNGLVYDLADDVSLARCLRDRGFDIWIVHPRGTGHSSRGRGTVSLDDFAIDDIPAITRYVRRRTGKKPVFVGHSQGGISALMSMMGPVRDEYGDVVLSVGSSRTRQGSVLGLVTLGSYPDFQFSKPSALQDFVVNGISLWGGAVTLLRAEWLLAIVGVFRFLPNPILFDFRERLLQDSALRRVAFPVVWLLNFAALVSLWEFLYHRPDVSKRSRRLLLYRTVDGTFPGILRQFATAIAEKSMTSSDGRVDYSAAYHLLHLPCSIVGMERDSLADPKMMEKTMFARIASTRKHFTEWEGMGHEDLFMNPDHFPLVLKAVRKVLLA